MMEQEYSLVSGWRWVRLGDPKIATIIMGQSPPGNTYVKEPIGLPFYQGAADFGEINPTPTTWCTSPKRIAESNDILISVRAPIGPTNLALEKCCIGRGLASIRPREPLNPFYLLSFLRYYEQQLVKAGNVSTFGSVGREQIEAVLLPLPSRSAQDKITAYLQAQMAEAQRLHLASERQTDTAQLLQPAYLRDVFEDLANQNWPKVALGELGDIVSGITLGRKLGSEAQTRSVPYLRVANVKDGYLDLSEVYVISATKSEIERYRLQYGDLLLTEGGDRDKLGRGTFWEIQIPECIHQNHIFRVRFDLNQISPQFASYQMESSYGKAYFLAHAKQTTGIATINQEVLSGFPFILSPLEEQNRVVMKLKPQLYKAQEIRYSTEKKLEAIEALPHAILQEIFNGFVPPAEN